MLAPSVMMVVIAPVQSIRPGSGSWRRCRPLKGNPWAMPVTCHS